MNSISNKLSFIRKLKNKIFPFYKKKEVKKLFSYINDRNSQNQKVAMFVGGCVRKFLSNEEIDDIDIATIFTPEQLKERFNKSPIKIVDTGLEHGSITAIVDKIKFELTTLRKDLKTDGRHAEIEYTDDWKIDSDRRDFTINAIYLDENGNLFDPQLGTKDLERGIVKFIGDPEKRIEEDYLRIIRLLRFVLQYKSNIDESTLRAVKTKLNGINKLSKERILKELIKIIELDNFKFINNYKNLIHIFNLIFPELKHYRRLVKLSEINNYFQLNSTSSLALLLIDNSNNYEYFCHKYKVSNNLKNRLKNIFICFNETKFDKNFFSKNLKKSLYLYSYEILKDAFLINYTDKKNSNSDYFLSHLKKLENTKRPVFPYNGRYLKKKGLTEGKNFGLILKSIEELWLKKNFNLLDEEVLEIINKHR